VISRERANVFVGNDIELGIKRYRRSSPRQARYRNTEGIGLDIEVQAIWIFRGKHRGYHGFPEPAISH
jgi:hypothetical protein